LAFGDDFLARAFVVGLKKLGVVTIKRFPFFVIGNIKCTVKGILCRWQMLTQQMPRVCVKGWQFGKLDEFVSIAFIQMSRKWCFWWKTSIYISNFDRIHSEKFKHTWDYGHGTECSESNSSSLGYVAQQHIKSHTDCSVTHKIAWLSHTNSNRKFNHIQELQLYVVSSNDIGFFHFGFCRKKLKTSKKI